MCLNFVALITAAKDHVTCELCGKAIPQANISLHRLRCSSQAIEAKAEMVDDSCRHKTGNHTNIAAKQSTHQGDRTSSANVKKEKKKKKEK